MGLRPIRLSGFVYRRFHVLPDQIRKRVDIGIIPSSSRRLDQECARGYGDEITHA
jgi:hypothetical protein